MKASVDAHACWFDYHQTLEEPGQNCALACKFMQPPFVYKFVGRSGGPKQPLKGDFKRGAGRSETFGKCYQKPVAIYLNMLLWYTRFKKLCACFPFTVNVPCLLRSGWVFLTKIER